MSASDERTTIPKPALSYASPTTRPVLKVSALHLQWITAYLAGAFLADFALDLLVKLLGKDGSFIIRYEGVAGILDSAKFAAVAGLVMTVSFAGTLSLRIYPTGHRAAATWKHMVVAGLANGMLLFGGIELTDTLRGGHDGRYPLVLCSAMITYPAAIALWSGFRGQRS